MENNKDALESGIKKLVDEVNKNTEKKVLEAYARVLVDTDYHVQIFHDSSRVEKIGSPLGARIADALKAFGPVNHSVWFELPKK